MITCLKIQRFAKIMIVLVFSGRLLIVLTIFCSHRNFGESYFRGTVKIYLEALRMPGDKSGLKVFQTHLFINLIKLKVVKCQYITATFVSNHKILW